ncbi:hypothetical protein H261_07568 [Paramagnetospirillum caucaseum]|uniref:Uncharacterized protein n=1 Tax=Paramagnetospirillum caucaseum TaxID=1244869 RepID=M2ZTC4_9PROT|nr:SlyX family protein [Paramagnetospirillum caucaseum]EME70607.1 hypothetical protein H261_07568 [Paramagnetospirillum caucaseum]
MSVGSRLDGLETALAHAEMAIQDLSDVTAAQARDLEALRRENRNLARRLERLEAAQAGDGSGEDFIL